MDGQTKDQVDAFEEECEQGAAAMAAQQCVLRLSEALNRYQRASLKRAQATLEVSLRTFELTLSLRRWWRSYRG